MGRGLSLCLSKNKRLRVNISGCLQTSRSSAASEVAPTDLSLQTNGLIASPYTDIKLSGLLDEVICGLIAYTAN